MLNFKKLFIIRIISTIVLVTFTVTSTCYGIDLPDKMHLRPNLTGNSKEGKQRLQEALSLVRGQPKVSLDPELTSVSPWLPESLRGQEPRLVEGENGWVKTAQALAETKGYKEFQEDRKSLKFVLLAEILEIYSRFAASIFIRNGIYVPIFYKEIRSGIRLWMTKVTQRSCDNISDWTYTVLGREKAYGATHTLFNTQLLPEEVMPDYSRRLFGFLPLDVIGRKYFARDAKWEANDYRTRRKLALEIARHAKEYKEGHDNVDKVIILDVGGGNGELAALIARSEELPSGVLVVVREYNNEMIAEGREKIASLKEKGMLNADVVFIQGDAQAPFKEAINKLVTEREQLPEADRKDLETLLIWNKSSAPVVGAVTAYTMGAMHFEGSPYQVAQNIAVQMAEDISEGGKVLIVDFANPVDDRDNYLKQTGPAGKAYFFWQRSFLLGKFLEACYKNWDHRVGHLWNKDEPGNLEKAAEALGDAGFTPERRWNQTTFVLLPVIPQLLQFIKWAFSPEKRRMLDKEEAIATLLLPGYAEETLSYVKPVSINLTAQAMTHVAQEIADLNASFPSTAQIQQRALNAKLIAIDFAGFGKEVKRKTRDEFTNLRKHFLNQYAYPAKHDKFSDLDFLRELTVQLIIEGLCFGNPIRLLEDEKITVPYEGRIKLSQDIAFMVIDFAKEKELITEQESLLLKLVYVKDDARGILNALGIPTEGIESQITTEEAQDAWFSSTGKLHEAVKLIVDKRVQKIRSSDKTHIETITLKQKHKINSELTYVLLDHFPDGELYLRLIDSERIKGSSVTVKHSLSSASDFIELFFLTHALGYYGAKGIEIDLESWRPRFDENGSMHEEDKALLIILNACAESVVIRAGSNTLSVPKVSEFEKKGLPLLTDDISFTDKRFADLANFEARKIGCRTNYITVESAIPGHWDVTCEFPAENRGITLLNSMTSDEEIVRLLIASAVLRNKGARHIAYLDLLQAYGRQDKIFLNGEIISAEAMFKALHIFGDKIVTNNPHFVDETGWIKFGNFDIHVVSSFIQLGEHMFCEIVKDIIKRETIEDIDVSKLTREQRRALGKKFGALLLSEFEKHPLLLVSPDKGAAFLEQEAAKLLEAYIKREFGIEIRVYSGTYNKERDKITRKTTMWGPIMGPDGTPLAVSGKENLSDCWVFILDDTTATGGTVFQATYLAHFEDNVEWRRICSGIVHVDFSKRDNPFNHGLSEEDIANGKIPEPDHANKMLVPRGLWTTQSYPPTVSKVKSENIVPLTDLIKYVIEKVLIDTTGVPKAVKDPSVSAKVFQPTETDTHWDNITKAYWLGRGKSNNPEDIADYILSEYDALGQSISTLPETMQEQINRLGILKCSRDIFGWLQGAQIDSSTTLDRVIGEAQRLRDLLFELRWDAEARESDAAYRWMKRYSNIWASTYELLRLYHNGNLSLTHTIYMSIFGEVYKGLFFIQRLATEEVREPEALSLERINTIRSEVKKAVDDILIYPPVRQAVHILSKGYSIEEENEQLICRLFEKIIARSFIEHRSIRLIVEEEFTNMPQEIRTLQDWLTIDSLSSYIEMVMAGKVFLPYKVYQEEDLGQGLSRIVVEPEIESSNIVFLRYWDKKDKGYAFVVIDGGSPQFMPTLKAKVFKELGIVNPAKQIKRIILTHGDPDHLGMLEIASEYSIPFKADPYLFTTVWDRGLPRKVLSQSFTSDLTRIVRGFVELDQETLKRLFQPYPEKQADIFLKGHFFDFLDDEIIGDTDWAVVRAEGYGHSFESLMLIQWPDTVERITVPEEGSRDVRLPPYVIVKVGNLSEAIPFNAQVGDEKRVEAKFQSRIRHAIEIWVGLREKVIDIISGDMGVEGKAMPKGQSRMVRAYLQMTGQVPDIEPIYGRSIHRFITGFRGARITPSHGDPYVNSSSVKTESLDKVKPVVIVTGAGELAADCIIKTLKERGYIVLATTEDSSKAESLSKELGIEVVGLNIEADAGLRKRIEEDVIGRVKKDSESSNPIIIVNTHNDPGFVRTIAEASTQFKRQVFLIHLGSAESYQPNERISSLVALEKSQDPDIRRMQLAEDTVEGVDTISPFPYVILRLPFLLGPERNPIGDIYKGMPGLARWFRYASSESIKPWLKKPAVMQYFLTTDTLGYIVLGVILGLKEPMMWRNMFYAPEGIPISSKFLINIWRWRSQQDKMPFEKSPAALHLSQDEVRILERMLSKDYPVSASHTAALRLQYLFRRFSMSDDNARSQLPEDILDRNPLTSQINYTFKAVLDDLGTEVRSQL